MLRLKFLPVLICFLGIPLCAQDIQKQSEFLPTLELELEPCKDDCCMPSSFGLYAKNNANKDYLRVVVIFHSDSPFELTVSSPSSFNGTEEDSRNLVYDIKNTISSKLNEDTYVNNAMRQVHEDIATELFEKDMLERLAKDINYTISSKLNEDTYVNNVVNQVYEGIAAELFEKDILERLAKDISNTISSKLNEDTYVNNAIRQVYGDIAAELFEKAALRHLGESVLQGLLPR